MDITGKKASSTNCSKGITKAAILILLLMIPLAAAISQPISGENRYPDLSERKTRLGSRPPRCVKRCYGCSPCDPHLVVTQSSEYRTQMEMEGVFKNDEYYLLTWKCKCKDKYFQP